jgi:hypothetical protein
LEFWRNRNRFHPSYGIPIDRQVNVDCPCLSTTTRSFHETWQGTFPFGVPTATLVRSLPPGTRAHGSGQPIHQRSLDGYAEVCWRAGEHGWMEGFGWTACASNGCGRAQSDKHEGRGTR